MTSQERRVAFAKHVGEDTAKEINTSFEKAMISNQQTALANWAKKTFSGEPKRKGQYKSTLDKIQELEEKGLLTPENTDTFLQDLVTDKLGISISPSEAKQISTLAKNIEDLSTDISDIGLPSTKWWEAKSKMDQFIQSQQPSNQLKVASSTIGRGMMLASVKSPLVNIISNTVQGVITAFERRFSSGQYTGLNNTFARKFIKENMKIYEKSGYDTSRMIGFGDDKHLLGENIVHSQGKGFVRAAGRMIEDTVFKQLMGAPDVAYSGAHFADSANLSSTKMAQGEGLKGKAARERALEIFKDAVQIEPKTIDGEIVRSQAIADAQYATFTDETIYSDTALKIREVFNKMLGNARAGDQIMPFVKTPANVVGAGIDYSGVAAPAQLFLLPRAIAQARSGERVALQKSIRTLVRSGLGLTAAFALSSVFDPEDFIGNYPVSEKERKLLELKNATPNSVKVNGKWVSLDYFGPLAAPFIGMMYARKYGGDAAEKVIKYYQGVGIQALKVPGFQDFQDIVKNVQDLTNEAKTGKEELTSAATGLIIDFIRSRTVPAIVNDIAKATDPNERVADVKEDPLARIKASIPGLRETLPAKKTVFGDSIKAEDGLSTLVFGSRVKTENDNTLIKELVRLDEAGQLPSITDVEKNSKYMKELKKQIGKEKFKDAMTYYQAEFKSRVQELITNDLYKEASDEKKKNAIDNQKDKAIKVTLIEYDYQVPE